MTARWEELVAATVGPRPLALTRVVLGLAGLVWLFQFSRRFGPGFDPDRAHLAWPVVGHRLEGLPSGVAWALVAAGSLVLLTGFAARAAAASLALGIGLYLAVDQQHYGNASYFLVLVATLLAVTDSGAARTPWGPDRRRAEWWPTFLLGAQLSIVYGYAAAQKFRRTSLRGDTIEYQLHGPLSDALAWSHLPEVLNLAGGVAELFLAVAFWFAPTRRIAAVVGVGLHLGVLLFLRWDADMGAFGLATVAVYPVYWAAAPPLAEAVRRWLSSR